MARIPAIAVRRRARGFSLIELMIALAVITIGIVGIMSVVLWSQRNEMAVREKMVAQNAARQILERIRGTPFDDVVSTYQNFPFDAGNLKPRKGDPDGRVGRVMIDTSDPSLLDVTVSVEWAGAYPGTSVSFRTLIASR